MNNDTAPSVEEKLSHLRSILRRDDSALVCFSGGVDSALLLHVAASELRERVIALTAVSPSLPERELAGARGFAKSLGVLHIEASSAELLRPGYVANGPDRCFHCKSELYAIAHRTAEQHHVAVIYNGANLDDLGDHRPGLVAAQEAGARSPLVEARFSKADVRTAAEALGLPAFNKPAAACLASRLPYGMKVTRERLRQVEDFESALLSLGFRVVRVRHHDTIARIEVALDELPRLVEPETSQKVLELGKALGFQYVTLDLGGYRMGSHNELLPGRALPVLKN
jgi:pyridinium-3,5-biscarboxylic acid mononucleotide sulfurtransferase